MLLAFVLHDGSTMTITEDDPVWTSITETLPSQLAGSKKTSLWTLELIADADAKVQVYSRVPEKNI